MEYMGCMKTQIYTLLTQPSNTMLYIQLGRNAPVSHHHFISSVNGLSPPLRSMSIYLSPLPFCNSCSLMVGGSTVHLSVFVRSSALVADSRITQPFCISCLSCAIANWVTTRLSTCKSQELKSFAILKLTSILYRKFDFCASIWVPYYYFCYLNIF